MAFWGDYHTHSQYSRKGKKLHAKGAVLDNARAAARAGLKELAITDHGFGHVYGVEGEEAFEKLREDCERAEKETGVKIYVGLENNLDPHSGEDKSVPPFIALDEQTLAGLDIVQGGYHAFIGTPKLGGNIAFWTRNVIFKFLPGRKKLIARNTAAYKRLIDEYPLDFIGHLNRGILADAVEVARYAHEHGVYIELNGRHKTLKKKEIARMVELGVEFICSSDAHTPERVGKMDKAEELIRECDIPYELIANWERLPQFRSRGARAKRGEKESDVDDQRT